ncbi:MAG: hypothetical protein ACE5EX_12315, partial [Phycisphaerae bacterium]
MASKCPVCREPVPWTRRLFNLEWRTWTCSGCESVLAINVLRRLAVSAVAAAAMIGVTWANPAGWDMPVVLGTFVAILGPYFVFFDRPRVVERHGFHCGKCGYDLQGQVVPRCPECGEAFDKELAGRMKRAAAGASRDSSRRGPVLAVVLIMVLSATVVGTGLLVYKTRMARRPLSSTVRRVADVLFAYTRDHDGRMPGHALRLAADGRLPAVAFVSFDTLTDPARVPVADVTLAQFDSLAVEPKASVAQAAAAALPSRCIAYRVGDFVFTYRGRIDAETDPDLWVVLWSPDPAQNPGPSAEESIPIGLASGRVVSVSVAELDDAFAEQNRLRLNRG